MGILMLATLVRSPTWWILVLTSAGLSWLWNVVGADASVGDLGRQVLATTHIIGFLFAALFGTRVVLMELTHSDVVRSTAATEAELLVCKLLAVGVAGLLAVLSGTTVSFVINAIVTRRVSVSGTEWVALYLLWSLALFIFWTTFAMFLLCLRCRPWLTIVISTLAAIGMPAVLSAMGPVKFAIPFGLRGGADTPTVFSPLGLFTVEVLLLRLASLAGATVVILGATLLAFTFTPESATRKKSVAIALLVSGLAVLGAGVLGAWSRIAERVAPFSVQELWEGQASLERAYTVDKEGHMLVTPRPYVALALPAGHAVPSWIHEYAAHNQVEVSSVELDSWSPYATRQGVLATFYAPFVRARLILLYPTNVDYPQELGAVVAWFKMKLRPMMQLAQLWEVRAETLRIVVVPLAGPTAIYPFPNGLIVPYSVGLRWGTEELWGAAWALATMAHLGPEEQAYVAMCLAGTIAPREVERGLRFYEAWSEKGSPSYNMPWYAADYVRATRGIYEPKRVLDHWHRGTELGHNNYIRVLLERTRQ